MAYGWRLCDKHPTLMVGGVLRFLRLFQRLGNGIVVNLNPFIYVRRNGRVVDKTIDISIILVVVQVADVHLLQVIGCPLACRQVVQRRNTSIVPSVKFTVNLALYVINVSYDRVSKLLKRRNRCRVIWVLKLHLCPYGHLGTVRNRILLLILYESAFVWVADIGVTVHIHVCTTCR